jgi:hypothetical protein
MEAWLKDFIFTKKIQISRLSACTLTAAGINENQNAVWEKQLWDEF